MKELIKYITAPILFFLLAAPAFAQQKVNPCPQAETGPGAKRGFDILCELNLANAFPALFNAILVISILIALFYLIWGGVKWIVSGGDKAAVETARNTIISAVIGLIVIFLAWFIITLILQVFFGRNINDILIIPPIKLN